MALYRSGPCLGTQAIHTEGTTMSIYKPKGSEIYWVEFRYEGQRIRRSAGTSSAKDARQFEAQLKNTMWKEAKMGVAPDKLWDDAVERYLVTRTRLRSIETTKDILRWLTERLRGVPLQEITNDLWLKLVKELKQIGNRKSARQGVFRPITDSRVNKYRAALTAVLSAAHESGWIAGVPAFWKGAESKTQVRFASREEVVALFSEMPLHLAYPAAYAMFSGVRTSNVTGLLKSQVHWEMGLIIYSADEMKGDEAHVVPITSSIEAILRDCWNDHETHVFVTHRGKPWQGRFSNHGWYDAMDRAGVKRFTWHSWRHTWATWHRMNGTSLGDLQALGGWSSRDMVDRYAHFNNDLLIRAAQGFSVGGTQRSPHSDEVAVPSACRDSPQPTDSEGEFGVADGTRTHDNWNHKAGI